MIAYSDLATKRVWSIGIVRQRNAELTTFRVVVNPGIRSQGYRANDSMPKFDLDPLK